MKKKPTKGLEETPIWYGWAIRVPGSGFIGTYWFSPDRPLYQQLPTSIFSTKKMAIEYLKRVRGPKDCGKYPNAYVVKVTIHVSLSWGETI